MNINELMSKNIIEDEQGQEESKSPVVELKNSTVIKGKTYIIKPLKWGDAIDLWENLMKVALPSIGSAADGMMGGGDVNVDTVFGRVFTSLAKNLSGNDLKHFSIVLMHGATVDGKALNIEEEFTGNYGAWIQLLVFALECNYSSFFEDGLGVKGIMGLMAQV